MTDRNIELSRRKALAALGTIGAAGAGAGLGTSAFFSDQETFSNNQLVAGELDMKVAATHHYSDWLKDTEGPDAPGSPQEVDDGDMPNGGDADIRLVADENEDDGDIELALNSGENFAEGSVVKKINGGADSDISCDGSKDADGPMLIDLDDVKPGDFGLARFCFRLCDNPGYVWLDSRLDSAGEGAITEPEREDPDEDHPDGDTVELLDEVQVEVLGFDAKYEGGKTGGSNPDDSEAVLAENDPPVEIGPGMTLREFLGGPVLLGQDSEDPGTIPADEGGGSTGRCYEATDDTNCVTLVWWLPIDHGNEIQGDFVQFDLGFYTEQCRHNNGALANDVDDPAFGNAEQ